LRLSDEIQEEMDRCETRNDSDQYAQLLERIQKTVLKEFGFEGTDQDLHLFRQGLGMYPDDKELQSIPYYAKYNRVRDEGDVKMGDLLKDVTLTSTQNATELISLKQFYENECAKKNLPVNLTPFVIIAGSVS